MLREVGPILIRLMFSGASVPTMQRISVSMVVTEQVDGLRALAVEPIPFLIVPRVLAMMIAMFCLLVLGDAVAIVGGMLFGKLLLGVDFASFYASLVDSIGCGTSQSGCSKGHFRADDCADVVSLRAQRQGGAVGVGHAVNDAVVAAALLIMVSDDIWTMVLR